MIIAIRQLAPDIPRALCGDNRIKNHARQSDHETVRTFIATDLVAGQFSPRRTRTDHAHSCEITRQLPAAICNQIVLNAARQLLKGCLYKPVAWGIHRMFFEAASDAPPIH